MPRTLVKLSHEGKDYYLEWSSVVDAPVTFGMPIEEFKEYYQAEYGQSGMRDLRARLDRVERYGTSSPFEGSDVESLVGYNRAGPNETCLTLEGIIEGYVVLRHLDQSAEWEEKMKPFIRPEEEYLDV